jgi:hypothetical protein
MDRDNVDWDTEGEKRRRHKEDCAGWRDRSPESRRWDG